MSEFDAAVERAEQQQLIADLKAARAVLSERGWTKGEFVDADSGRVCVLGAIGMALVEGFEVMDFDTRGNAVDRDERSLRVIDELGGHLQGRLPKQRYLWLFNDAPNTQFEDITELFDKTLADLGGLT